MMQFIKKYLFIILMVAAIQSCQKDVDIFVPDNNGSGPDTTWQALITPNMPVIALRNVLLPEFQRDSAEANSAITITSNAGLRINLVPNLFVTQAGTTVTGRIQLRTMLLRRKGEIIRNGLPTISNGNVMVSGGEVFISARKDSTELLIAPGMHLDLRYEDINPLTGLKIFNTGFGTSIFYNWIPNQDLVNNKVYTVTNGYELFINKMGWINCGKVPDTTGIPQARIAAGLPSNYTNANSLVYVSFNNQRTVMLMEPNVAGRFFKSFPITVGTQVTVIVISKQVNDYYLGHSSTTVLQASLNTSLQFVGLNPVKTSLENIKLYLAGL